jgi:demethylmacrocin O-methyltransferase
VSQLLELRDRVPERYRRTLKRWGLAVLSVVPVRWNLELVAIKHGTDKWTHGYIPFYRRHFAPFRRKRFNLLEIGIGTVGPRGGGDSLRMWREFFPNATIWGLDILDKASHAERRINIVQGSQNDADFLRSVAARIGRIDIVIDDGSHVNEHVLTSFTTLFPLLAAGGLYVIEDMETSYFPKFGGNWRNLDDPATMMNLVKRLCDHVNSALIPSDATSPFDLVGAVHVYPGIAFISKVAGKRRVEPSAFLGKP